MFRDRSDAAVALAEKLDRYKNREDVIVLALPRGGAVTGFEISSSIGADFDVLIVRKIGFPGQRELAVGAVSETGAVALNERIIGYGGVTKRYLDQEIEAQKEEIARRVKLYRGGSRLGSLEGRTVIIVDDGVATGATMKAAILALKEEKLGRLVVAVPVAPPDTAEELRAMADEFVCLLIPPDFMAVGNYYRNFTQVTDEEVADLLMKSRKGG